MHPFPPIQSHQGLFSAKVLANKKAGRLQIISLMWSCNTSGISSSHATMRKANGPPKHTASPKRNDRGCWNQSRPLLYTCQSACNQEGSSPSILLMWNCNTSGISSSHATMCKANGPPKHTASPKRNDRGCWNQSRPLLYTCQSACNQEGSSPSILLMWNCNTSGISSSHATMRQANGPKHIANPK